MLRLFYRIITLCYSTSWPLSRKDATRWNVAVLFPDTADCSLRRCQEDATPPSSGRAARCEGDLSAGPFRHVLHHPVFQHIQLQTVPHSSPLTQLTVSVANCANYPILQPPYHRHMLHPPPSALRSDIYSYICGLHNFVREQGVQEDVWTDRKK